MTDESGSVAGAPTSRLRGDSRRRRGRRRAERRFRAYGLVAITFALSMLVILLASMVFKGFAAFTQYQVELDVRLDAETIDPEGGRAPQALATADYDKVIKRSLHDLFPTVSGRKATRELQHLVSSGAGYELRERVTADPDWIGTQQRILVPLGADADLYLAGRISRSDPESDRRLSDRQIDWLDALEAQGRIHRVFNTRFLFGADSREAELAGVGGAVVGSVITLLVTLLACFPIGVAAAVHLEEFAPKNRVTSLIEVNINNLAAVPSIVFGLLGLAVFLGFFGMARSAPLVGGLVLALRTLPIVIIVSRTALAAVPPSIREAALGLGASRLQLVSHHLLPLALPGILTGTIIGMAQALGETAPLLMVGMVAFVADIPHGLLDPATVLPVQVYLWSDTPERGFEEKTAGAIIVLLGLLLVLNASAVYLRERFERRV